jgi:hypothetical protein
LTIISNIFPAKKQSINITTNQERSIPFKMQFSIIAIITALAITTSATPVANASPAAKLLARAINYSYFTPEEIAETSMCFFSKTTRY